MKYKYYGCVDSDGESWFSHGVPLDIHDFEIITSQSYKEYQ